ncbi:hypothetical protein [Massilia glaciei]|uniref:C2H2-type domain-containing protein n=1 Tax=Massilia glaciei TaxID=1524097 RepID=A0A2U2HJ14_9BURK|nr:hypothetical protein [Massilia glaciei]PWF46825.1 hypothetical protein C7C56_015210 [Massilia glaciei]
MGFWHTGNIEHHEPTGLDFTYQPREVVYFCPACSERFDTLEVLRRHRFEAHSYTRPLMFVRGLELGATPLRVTRQLVPEDVQLDRALSATLNGKKVLPANLPELIAKVTNDRLTIVLSNEGASAQFELLVHIASEADLVGVEAAFLKLANARSLSIASIEGFIADCIGFETASAYGDGICHYLYGVLAKERAGDSSLPFEEYSKRYSRAADQLLGFERPLAQIIRALVAFHFNHFEDAQTLVPAGRLQHAAVLFAGLLEGWPWHHEPQAAQDEGSALVELLTDHETLRILRWTELGTSQLMAYANDIAAQTKREIPGFDRLKLQLMLAEAKAAQGDADGARQAARELRGNSRTTIWAEALLARLPDKESGK